MNIDMKEAARVELATMTGAWRDLAARWDLVWRERRMLFPAGGEELAEPPGDTETRMRIMVEIGYRLPFDTAGEIRDWLREPTELWAWHSPLEVMAGRLSDLRRFRCFVEQGLGS